MTSRGDRGRQGSLIAGRRSLMVLAVLIFAGVPAASAQGATINFDDLSAPGPGSGGGTPVNTQYNSQGVTFNDPSAFDYSQGSGAIPGFAHSGTIAVEPCVGAEFCTSPVRATFTVPQRDVGVWVGLSFAPPSPVGVRLTGFDASDAVVETADATVPASSSPVPIDTHLTLSQSPAQIVKIEVSVTTGGGFTNGLAVDDVEFTTEGPPPPCTATSVPTVTLTQPQGGRIVHTNEFILQGDVTTGGGPLTAASITAERPAGDFPAATRTSSIYPTLIQSDGGSFGPIRVNGLLNEEINDITVSATNCLGTGTSAPPRRVIHVPLPSTTKFRQLGVIEVTQSVQTDLNSVLLIARSANGIKRTFARVILHAEDSGGLDVTHVSGTLTALLPDGSHPPGPLTVPSINPPPGGYVSTGTYEDNRSRLFDPLIFELPAEWLNRGELHLQLDKILIEGTQSTYPCLGCENIGTVGFPPHPGPAPVRFRAVPPLRLWVVSMPYRQSGSATPIVPSQTEIDTAASLIRRMYPTADLQVIQSIMPTADNPPATCIETRNRLRDWAAAVAAQDPQAKFLGLLGEPSGGLTVKDSDGNVIGGCASGQVGWVKAQDEMGGAHELGHMFNLRHVAGCQLFAGSTVDGTYPHPNGLIGHAGSAADALGLDAGDSALSLGMQLFDWRNGFTDVMTYCPKKWISDWNYRNIAGTLCSADLAHCPDHVAITGHSRERGTSAAPELAAKKGGPPRLQVSGTLSPGSGRASIDSLAVLRRLALTSRPKQSSYAIVLRGGGGRELARYPFEPGDLGEEPKLSIDEVVKFKPGTERISIAQGKKTLDSARVSANAPTVQLISRKSGKGKGRAKGKVRLRWRADDPDGGRLTYAVQYAADGNSYVPVAADLRKRSFRANLGELAGGSRARFRVIASDGVLTGTDTSKRLKVAAKAPRVLISTPVEGAELTAGEPIQFVASVQDLQDLPFAGSNVVWRSSIQGELGRGTAITATLTEGTHTITATATNSAGKASTATVTVNVVAVPPVFVADVGP